MAKKTFLSETDAEAVAEYIVKYQHDPLGFVETAFPWGQSGTPLEHETGPYPWQREVLEHIGNSLSDGELVVKMAVASGNGIGKSCLTAWIILWAFSTYPNTRGTVTANTEDQLRTKTLVELNTWYNMWLLRDCFVLDGWCLHAIDKENAKTWRADAVTWSERNPEAVAGLHNKGKREFMFFDEASAIADSIWEAVQGATVDKNTEIIWIAFGNPTRRDGYFYECFHSKREFWYHRQIDSRTVPGSNLEEIEKWKKEYGEDSDWFRVHVKGQHPKSNENQFISTELVEAAQQRVIKPGMYEFAPVVLGVDAAWTGGDKIVITLRQGLFSKILAKFDYNNNDGLVANQLARLEDEYHADAVFIDLGYGTGIYSFGKMWNRSWTLVAFGGKSIRKDCINKRTEMWKNAEEWLKEGGALPAESQELADDLKAPLLIPNSSGLLQIESKKEIKKRLKHSTDYADSLIITFAFPVLKKSTRTEIQNTKPAYDPFAGM